MKLVRGLFAVGLILVALALAVWFVPDDIYFAIRDAILGQQQITVPEQLPLPDADPESAAEPREEPEAGDQRMPVLETGEIVPAMAAAIAGHETPVSLRVTVPDSDDTGQYLLGLVGDAFTSIRRDYPEYFWIALGEYGIEWIQEPESDQVELNVKLDYCYDADFTSSRQAQIEQVVEKMILEAPTSGGRAKLLQYLHDWIVNQTVYATDVAEGELTTGSEYAYNIDGVFLRGRAVCEGYAKSYKLLCDRLNIPCVVVFGDYGDESHAWNYVQVEGDWYLVDCTADDPVGNGDVLRWECFLKGRDGLVDGIPVRQAYIEDGGEYPVLSPTDYETGLAEASAAAEIGSVSVELVTQLREGSDLVRPGASIATVLVEDGAGCQFQLTGAGDDDSRFSIGRDTGVISIREGALTAGEYRIQVRISREQAGKLADISFSVLEGDNPDT